MCCHDISVVGLLCIAGAKAQAEGCLLAGFLCLWWRVLAEAADRFRELVEWAFVAEAVGGRWVACMLAQAEALASALVGKGCLLFTECCRSKPTEEQCLNNTRSREAHVAADGAP